MKKLLIVTDAWHPQVNGNVVVFDSLTRTLRSRGWQVHIVHPGLSKTIPFPFYPEIPMALFPGKVIRAAYREFKPDYVHVPTEWTMGLSARRFCKRNGIPFSTSYHTNFHVYAAAYISIAPHLARRVASLYMRWFHRAAYATLVATKTLHRELEADGFRNLRLWPLGVDTERFRRNQASPYAAGLKHPVFAYCGRVALEKNIGEFLKADLPGTKIVIGDGPVRRALEHTYAKSALFVGYQHGQMLVDWLSAADVCIFPSRTDTFGLTILEALSCGVPVAAHRVLGPQDILTDGVDGALDEDLSKAAERCLSLSPEACRATAERYSWERSADAFISAL